LWLGNSKQKKLQNFFELFFCGQQQQKQKPNRSQIIVTNFLGNETGEKFKNKIKTKSQKPLPESLHENGREKERDRVDKAS
jgi:hypothetical protein